MCGITGIVSHHSTTDSSREQLSQSLTMISHRGPDHKASFFKNKLGFAHARLAIIDNTEASNQPFHSADGRYSLIFNGEIYNFKELRHSLQQEGIEFHTEGDTELLLQLLIHREIAGLKEINGFFAFAFYDHELDRLLLARDRMGQKPLLYAENQSGLCFASELKALKPYLNRFDPDLDALGIYLQLGYIPAPYSAIQGVRKLMPGTYLLYQDGKLESARYLEDPCSQPIDPTTESSLFKLMDDAVRMRLMSERPLGCLLSGGIDSSIVTALAVRHHQSIDSYSIAFDSNHYLDESPFAAEVAKHLNTRHHRISFESRPVEDRVTSMLSSLSEPFADSSAIAYYALCQELSKELVVALSGDGADELFAGYRKHRAHLILSTPMARMALKFIHPEKGSRETKQADRKRKLGRLADAARLNARERYWFLASFAKADSLALLKNVPLNTSRIKEELLEGIHTGNLDEILCLDQQLVLPNDMLFKADSMSMAHGLEVRSPFMDPRIVNHANSLTSHQKINLKQGKLALRKEFAQLLPDSVWNRPKMGFEVPLQGMLSGELREMIDENLSASAIESVGILETQTVSNLLERFRNQPNAEDSFSVWSILVLQYWFRHIG